MTEMAQAPLEAVLALRADVTAELDGRRPAHPSVAFTGAALWLAFDEENYSRASETWLRDASRPPERQADRRYDVSVVAHDGRAARSTTLRGVHARYPMVQILPDDEILLVGARCRFTSDRTVEEDNAFVFGWDGTERRHFMLGDAIEDIQASSRGRIWISYFDEGVYGRVMWGGEGEPGPPSAAGLLSTDGSGRILWRFRPSAADIGRIDDCYALNVAVDAT
jgi:hypothetical protein